MLKSVCEWVEERYWMIKTHYSLRKSQKLSILISEMSHMQAIVVLTTLKSNHPGFLSSESCMEILETMPGELEV